jgi:hypothetical protein
VQDGAGKARPEGAGSTFEQFLEFVPDAIVGVGIDGEIPYGLKGEEIATIPCETQGGGSVIARLSLTGRATPGWKGIVSRHRAFLNATQPNGE